MRVLSGLFAAVVALGLTTTAASPARSEEVRLTGSGASFPFPIYSAWFKDFSKQNDGITIDYQAKGSGAGIQDFINKTVAFAASDAAMSEEEMAQVKGGVVLLPMTAGEIVLAYNLPGDVKDLKLAHDVYPDIFLGKITNWNDKRIAETNPGVKLPDLPITVVRRSDSSGTTFVFTSHLSAVSDEFKKDVGAGKTVEWPRSNKFVGAPKNDGVTATIKQTPGAIGYIEYGYAKLTGAKSAMLQNREGNFVAPGGEGGPAALASVDFDENLIGWVNDPTGADSYPIATFTWMLFYKEQDEAHAEALRKLVEYGVTDGQKMADKMGYIPLPENVIEKIRVAAEQIQ
jgi:phosphate transport system substrate-binding protein